MGSRLSIRTALAALVTALSPTPEIDAQEASPAKPSAVEAAAEDEDEHRGLLGRLGSDVEEGSWLLREELSGDWNGVRERFEERGFGLSLFVVSDLSAVLAGGVRRRGAVRALFDFGLDVDLERAAGLRDTTAFLEVYGPAGRDGSQDAGDVQAYSNIDEAEDFAQLAELWVQKRASDGRLRVKAGKLDANSEFAHVHAGLEFLHSSAGFSPTILFFPTYPDPAVSLNVFARPAAGWHVGLGVYNAEDGGAVSGRRGLSTRFDEAFLVGQVERAWGGSGDAGRGAAGRLVAGRLVVGAWHHTGALERFDGGTESGTEGAYAVLEQRLASEPADAEQGLTGFLQWGVADGDVGEFEGHLGAGLLWRGLLPGCEDWHTGLYASHANLSDAPDAELGADELALELFQQVRLTPWLVLKPDLQLVVDPAGRDDLGDAWIATVRLELTL